MRSFLTVVCLCGVGACGEPPGTTVTPDAGPHAADAALATADAAGVEDLDMTLEDFADVPGFMTPPGRGYRVANLLGHEAEALAAASAPTGAAFPVGSVVEVQAGEVMVKRRRGFDATTSDWEFFGIAFAADGRTPVGFSVRGTEATACFMCHAMVSSMTWDFVCDHP